MYTVELNGLLLLSLFLLLLLLLLLLCYVYPVHLFIFTDYLLRCSCFPIVIVHDCIWFCDDIVCILQAQQYMITRLLLVTAGRLADMSFPLLNSRLYTPHCPGT